MRQAIYNHIDSLSLGSFSLTNELPWTSSGIALYLKNPKRIYVDADQVAEDSIIATLNGLTLNTETYTVRVFFTTDAKQLPSNYETLVAAIRAGKNTTEITGVSQRICNVSTDFVEDTMVTQFEFRFTNIYNQ